MHSHKSTGLIFRNEHFYNWLALSFVAGAVNVGGLMACGRFVTHVTGFASLFGESLALKNPSAAFSMLSVPLFFLAGGFISGLLIDIRLIHHKRPHYGIAMTMATTCVGIAAVGGALGWWGIWGHELEIGRDYLFLAVLSLGSGIQNALVTSASGTVVRTTHLTGITTDLAVGLARIAFGKLDETKRSMELMSNELRAGSIFAFILGSGAGAFGFFKYGYLGFALPFVVLIYLTYIAKTRWENWIFDDA
jgi:uncharacterized membrane protein YoaK (UPF0700 family)